MSEPVSIWTYGMNELARDLEKQSKELGVTYTIVRYDADQDRILVLAWAYRPEANEAACGAVVDAIRRYAYVEHGKSVIGKGSTFTRFFEQPNHRFKNEPRDLAAKIDKLFVIQVTVTQSPSDGRPADRPDDKPGAKPVETPGKTQKFIECSAPLIGVGQTVKHR